MATSPRRIFDFGGISGESEWSSKLESSNDIETASTGEESLERVPNQEMGCSLG